MLDHNTIWDPNDWEKFVYKLLQDRHGPTNVCKVPAAHQGDCGLDYYCLSERVVYQCYAVEEPCDVKTRAERQRDKITEDIKKFSSKKSGLVAILSNVLVERWILVVPRHDSVTVNGHCSKKTREVLAANLPYVASDFEVIIQDYDSFDVESLNWRFGQKKILSIQGQPISLDEIDEWAGSSNNLVKTLEGKLKKRVNSSDPVKLDEQVKEAIGWFLERENALEELRVNAPDLHETLTDLISRHGKRLTFYGPPAEGVPSQVLRRELEELKVNIQQSIPNFSEKSSEQMAIGTIAEWLMRCPLDFPPYENV